MIRWLVLLPRAAARIRAAIRHFAGTAAEVVPEAAAYWDDSVALTLTDLVREAETRASGRVQVITLGEFRAAIGPHWDRYEQRILLIAESTIARMIGRGNTFIPQEKDTWLLLFPALPEADALNRADAIAAKIGEKLVGAQFTETPPPLPAAAKLDLKGAINADGSLNLERVKAAVENVRRAALPGAGLTGPQRMPAARAPRPPAPPSPTARSEAALLSIVFRPAWSAETQSINSFFFRPTRPDGSDVFTLGTAPPADATALDLMGIAGRALVEMCARGLRAVLTVPVPYPALLGPRLADFQRLIASLPQRDRLMQFRLEVTHVPARVGADSLVPIRELFRPYTREIAFLLDPYQPSEQVMALDHISIGAELPRGDRRADDELFQAMLHLRQRAGRRPLYVLGLSSRLQVANAVTAGVSEVGGAGVASDLKKLPDHLTILRRQDLLL